MAPTDKPFPDGDLVKLMGVRVVSSDSLPDGILMFVRDGQPIGMIDNRKAKETSNAP